MKITVTERNAVSRNDIDFTEFNKVGDVTYYDDVAYSELIDVIGDSDAVIVNKCVIDAKIMDGCPNLKYVGTFATGYNNIDTVEATKRGITVCNVPGYSTDAVAQHAMTFILMSAGNTMEYVSSVKRGEWKKSKTFCYYPYYITELKDKTLGIIGFGAIGKRVAQLGEAFGMKVIVHTRTYKKECKYSQVGLDEVFKESDFLSLHCPLTDKTKGIVNAQKLALMKKSAVIINTSRGPLIDELALKSALVAGDIRMACMDVIEYEPMREDCPLFDAPNCLITPHVAWAGVETRGRLVEIARQNLIEYIKGTPQNKVN